LELRFGIEARLYQYIDAELGHAKQTRKHLKEYAATKLLAQLTAINPKTSQQTIVQLTPEDGGKATTLAYTPVTRELANMHGQLGNLLHYTFFWINPYWRLKRQPTGPGRSAILQARDLVARGIEELSKAVSGNLLTNPSFGALVDDLNNAAPPIDG
jgi:hypothetical protein